MIRDFLRTGALALGILAVPAAAQTDQAARDFAERVIPQVEAALPDVTVTSNAQEPLQLDLAGHPDWEDAEINLHRIYNFCLSASKTDCQAELDNMLSVITQPQPEYGPENLRVVVRDADYFSYVLNMAEDESMPLHKQIGDDLFAIIALDSPQAIAIAPPENITDMGLTPDQAWELATKQTLDDMARIPLDEAEGFTEGMTIFEGEEYVASLLFDIEYWTKLSAILGPDMVVAAVSDQTAVVAVFDPELLEGFKEAVAADCNTAARCVSPNVYRLRDGMWRIAK